MSAFGEYGKYDGLGLAELVREKEVQPIELVEEAISRIEKLNPQLNAVIHTMYDLAREAAAAELPDGPFKGVPFLLKDLLAAYAGEPMSSGSRFHKDYVPDRDSEIVQRYKAAGLVILGKTNLPEYGLLPVTEPELHGTTHNPWDLTRTTGGSSGGSAAAVAAQMVPMAHGGDGGGSIRIPASCCGLFGLKPTHGRNPNSLDFEAWQGLVCEHVLSRSVRDSAAMLDATAGPALGDFTAVAPPPRPFLQEVGADPGKLRIAYTSTPFLGSTVHDDILSGLQETVALCRELGHEMVEAAPQIDGKAFAKAYLTMLCGEFRADIQEAEVLLGRKATIRDYEANTWALGLLGKALSAGDFTRATRQLQRTSRQIGRFIQGYDLLLTPTLALPPVVTGSLMTEGVESMAVNLLGGLNAGGLLKALRFIDTAAEQAYDFCPYTTLFNATGQPAMSVPLVWSQAGLPIGMHFVGHHGGEATLFRLAAQLEEARPWFDRRPPVCA